MLLSVLNKIIGPKSLEIKVDNIHSYNFDPKAVLVEVCQAVSKNFTYYIIFIVTVVIISFEAYIIY